jgi:hypothetical protein
MSTTIYDLERTCIKATQAWKFGVTFPRAWRTWPRGSWRLSAPLRILTIPLADQKWAEGSTVGFGELCLLDMKAFC